MADGADDFYQQWYSQKLWNLLPGIYRAQDATAGGAPGPLQELLNRIGTQTAVLRRSIDRLAENQSIETCDDWVIPYIGDLVATRLVSCMDARAQRLDVAKTIYYRRRAGTLGLLEELVADIAGRDARCVEFFRRLGRTRHQFDPPIGNAFAADADPWTHKTTYSPGQIVINGSNAYICTAGGLSDSLGDGPAGTAAAITDAGVTWGFYNPLGALIPAVIEGLAGLNSRTPAGGFADLRNAYAAANTNSAFDEFSHSADLRAGSQSFGWYNISHLGVFIWWLHSYNITGATPVSNNAANPCFTFDPTGRQIALFTPQSRNTASFGDDWVSPNQWNMPGPVPRFLWQAYPDQLYPAAFSIADGAGAATPIAYTEMLIHPETGQFSFPAGAPAEKLRANYHFGLMSTTGAGGFPLALLAAPPLPPASKNIQAGGANLANALNVITADANFIIEDSLTYSLPGTPLALAGHSIAITAVSKQRPVIRSTTAATLTITGDNANLVIQGVWLQGANILLQGSFQSITLQFVTLDPGTLDSSGAIAIAIDGTPLAPTTLTVDASVETLTLQNCITGPIITQGKGAIEQLNISDSIIQALQPSGSAPVNALQTSIGDIALVRCTILGPCAILRMDASETIFDQPAIAEDTQHGCIRFCAIAAGSALHAPYRSVGIAATGDIFTSRDFGNPNYARLAPLADQAILLPQAGDSITAGAQNGSEMGAFQSESVALQKLGLAAKFEEYAPLGIFPVWIEAD